MPLPNSTDIQEFQDIQDVQKKVGSLIRRTRIRLGLSAKEMAVQLHYDPSLISKIEKGKNISVMFIDKFLETVKVENNTETELLQLREFLEKARLKNAPNNTSTSQSKFTINKTATEKIWHSAKSPRAIFIGIALLVIPIIIWSIMKWYPITHRTIVGSIDFNRACAEQYPGNYDIKAILLDEHNVFAWKCQIILDGGKFNFDVDAMLACRVQYSSGARPDYKNINNAYSWYCYIP